MGSIESTKIITELLMDAVQKFGFATGVCLVLIAFMCVLIWRLLDKLIAGYQFTIKELNEQNKKYQDAYLQKRGTSNRKFLGESDNQKGADQ